MHLSGYDYRLPGSYAITICTKQRAWIFQHPILQSILYEEWNNLPQHYIGIAPGIIVVMPDHLHCILSIEIEHPKVKSVIEMIHGYKSCVANAWLRYIKENNIDLPGKIWQSKFYDHIIRGEQDFKAQQTYILNNPAVFEEKQRAQIEEKERKRSKAMDQEQPINKIKSNGEL